MFSLISKDYKILKIIMVIQQWFEDILEKFDKYVFSRDLRNFFLNTVFIYFLFFYLLYELKSFNFKTY